MRVTQILAVSLLVSVSLNAGLATYLVIKSDDRRQPRAPVDRPAPLFDGRSGISSLQRVLPRDVARQFKQQLHERREDIRKQSVELNQARQHLVSLLRQDTLEQAELEQAFAAVQGRSVAIQDIVQKEMIAALLETDPEVRNRMADRLEKLRSRRPVKRVKQ